MLAHVIELKKVEEPELELRFGAAYTEYKRRVPMLIPRPWHRGGARAPDREMERTGRGTTP